MRPFTDISGMHATDVGFASMGMASQMVVGASLDKLEEEIKHELSLLNLTNNKGNKHGFRILTRLKELQQELEIFGIFLEGVLNRHRRFLLDISGGHGWIA